VRAVGRNSKENHSTFSGKAVVSMKFSQNRGQKSSSMPAVTVNEQYRLTSSKELQTLSLLLGESRARH
jgi:hypothetical protein